MNVPIDRDASNSTSLLISAATPLHLSVNEALPQSPRFSQSTMAGSSKMALQTFSIENDILEISPQDEIYRFDEAANKQINREAPWAQECVLFSILFCYGPEMVGVVLITLKYARYPPWPSSRW